MRDIRAPSKVTTKTARKAKAACVWCIEIACDGGKRWRLFVHYPTRKEARARMDYQPYPLDRKIFRIRKYIRQDP